MVATAHPGRRWTAALLCLVAVVGGSWYAYRSRATTPGPAGLVAGYFAALQRGDAPAALGYGTVPSGPHTLLTSTVLREQVRIAPIRDVRVGTARRDGRRATVGVDYRLGFAGAPVTVHDRVGLHRAGASWRLDRVAVPVQISPQGAGDRMTVLGGALPDVPTMVFPGALPLRLDTALLRLVPASDLVQLDGSQTVAPAVRLSAAGRRAVLRALDSAMASCATAKAAPNCPLPPEPFIPGSLRGRFNPAARWATPKPAADPVGAVDVTGSATFHGSWRMVGASDRVASGSSDQQVPVHANVYLGPPVTVRWGQP